MKENFFSKLSDKDFYSDKLTHIYFNSKVEDKTIDQLINKIKDANSILNPKPILIHICSFGGSLIDGLRFLTIFKSSKVPIATIIDNYSCSAATFLSINSPYRIMNKYSYCLLHEYSINGNINTKRDYFINKLKTIEEYFNVIIDMYLKKTKFSKNELIELLQHNILLDYNFCLKKGIVDRVINISSNSIKLSNININDLLIDKNTNHLSITCDFNTSNIDLSIIKSNNSNKKNPYLIHPNHNECDKNNINILSDRNILKVFNIIPRIINIKSLKIGIIDTPITIDNLLPLLFTNKIYMYKHTFIICNFIYFLNTNNNLLIDDNNKNIKTLMNIIKKILKNKTKMKISDINLINKKFMIINSTQAKKLGLCHEIIDI